MPGLRILITNSHLQNRDGTATYVSDLASELLNRGHSPMIYSPKLGLVADEIQKKAIHVVDDLNDIAVCPDIIHGQNNLETVCAMVRFPKVPAVFFTHSSWWMRDVPPRIPRILRCVAVDYTCRERLLDEYGLPEDRVSVIYNAVNLNKFRPRDPLPERPRRALIFSNNSSAHFDAVSVACKRTGLELDVVGANSGNPTAEPERILGRYDIVFAKARCAIEAMAVGTAVVLCDFAGVGPMVTMGDFDRLRRFNFGHRVLNRPINADEIAVEISRFNAQDAMEVSRRIRAEAGLDLMVDEILNLYNNVIAEYKEIGNVDPEVEGRAMASFLKWFSLKKDEEELQYQQATAYVLRERIERIPMVRTVARLFARAASVGLRNKKH